MRLTAMELKIIQTNDNGMFGGTYLNDFEYVYNNTNLIIFAMPIT